MKTTLDKLKFTNYFQIIKDHFYDLDSKLEKGAEITTIYYKVIHVFATFLYMIVKQQGENIHNIFY